MKCDSPFHVMPKAGTEKVPVPCGRCPPCKIRRVNQWVFRMMEESKLHDNAHFITLTYDTHAVPISGNGFLTLHKSDLQKFFKRLRKLLPGTTIRYYACGEYGSTTNRPHYHAVVFGVADPELYAKAWSLDGKPIGMVHVGQVNQNSIAYTMKYIDKSNYSKKHSRDDRISEFALMSKRIGANYVNDQMVKYHTADLSRLYVTRPGGERSSMPKYYRDKIFTEQQRKAQQNIVRDLVEKLELQDQQRYYIYHPNADYSDYQRHITSGKYYRNKKFYSQQKKRD